MSARKGTHAWYDSPEGIVARRKKLGLNQGQFWSKLGMTQSGGSRYESGRNIPTPMKTLMRIVYGTDAEANALVTSLRQIEQPQSGKDQPAAGGQGKRQRFPTLPKGFGFLP